VLHCQAEVESRSGQGDALGVIRTTDGGLTWQLSPVLSGQSGQWWDMTCPSAEDCWAVGATTTGPNRTPGSAFILASHDGGHRWTQVPLPSGLDVVEGISCATDTECFALGDTQTSASGPLAHASILTDAPPGA
jgi:photosystem II stability/assembly factor-like uncharacterized protein